VDDDEAVRGILSHLLRREGYEALEAVDGAQALALVRGASVDAILLDIRMPGLDGLEVLRQIKLLDPELPVIMVTADGLVQHTVTAMRMGAHDYLVKPFENVDVIRSIRTVLTDRGLRLRPTSRSLSQHRQEGACLRSTMGSSEAVARLGTEVARVACSDFTVLILGETGTGKELVSRAIHAVSPRASAPFVAVDCGAIPDTLFESELFGHEKGAFTGSDRVKPGRFEVAGAGTLFLDEISNIPRGCQSKLLRALQERTAYRVGGTKPLSVGARIVAASNEDLETAVAKELFRSDLFFRVSEFVIRIPPLRERRQDIPFLAQRFMDQASRELGKTGLRLSERALHRLLDYNWPGNVRQLCSTVRRAVLLADEQIDEQHLGLPTASRVSAESLDEVVSTLEVGISLKQIVSRTTLVVERTALVEALRATGGNKARAARMLRIDYKTMHNKVKAHGLKTRGGGDQ
jgi:two-component system nitrogen regulation response regulator GlnG